MMDGLFGAPNVLRLERDRFRESLYGSRRHYWDMAAKSDRVHRMMSAVIGSSMCKAMDAAVQQGLHNTIVLSDTGFGWSSVESFHKRARGYGMKVVVYLFDVPLSVLIARNQSRPEGHRIPHDLLIDAFSKIHDTGEHPHDRWWLDPKKVDELIRFDETGEVMK